MAEEKQKLAFWLVPAPDSKSFFAGVIEELAQRFAGPVFEPHVTLRGAELDESRALDLLEKVAAASGPLQLRIRGVDFSEKYTRTLYVQFQSSVDASRASAAFAKGAGSQNGYEFDPHLSLLYKTMPDAAKAELAREIRIPFDHVSFDALKLVSVPGPIEAPEDVEAWRMLAERRLTGTAR